MGTNFYWLGEPPCPTCGHVNEEVKKHIGKSSGGWVFALHVYPEESIHDLPDWKDRWNRGEIVDEYGAPISPQAMEECITQRSWSNPAFLGYTSEAEFHRLNFSEPGPNGLVRYRVQSGICVVRYRVKSGICVDHGAGTWDLCVGDFF